MKKINNDIKEDYCSFEVSKLLKEKGFDIKCKTFFNAGSGWKIQNDDILRCGSDDDIIERPIIQMAIEWIRVNFGIHINSSFTFRVDYDKIYYSFLIYRQDDTGIEFFKKGEEYNSPQEANEQAILFTLNNL